jgi:transcriptional regulator with XRE-family HTH domain
MTGQDSSGALAERIEPVDQLVGRRVRMVRVSQGLSQSALASQLGLTFQQLQKYERGTNRVSASKLHDIARIFGVEVVSFFEDAADPKRLAEIADEEMPRRADLLIAYKLSQLPKGELKRQFIALIFMLANKVPPGEETEASATAQTRGK